MPSNTLTINKLVLNAINSVDNKWGIYFPSNSTFPYFEAQLALPSGDNTNYIGTQGTITLFIRPSITNYYQLESINANLVGKTVVFSGPSFNTSDPRFPGVIVYKKINDINGITSQSLVAEINETSSSSINNTEPFYWFNYNTNTIVGPVYTNLIEVQNTPGPSYQGQTSTETNKWFIFNGVDIPQITSSLTNSVTYNNIYNNFLINNTPTLTYYVVRSLSSDITMLDASKFNITKVDNTLTLKYDTLNGPKYSLHSIENYFFFTFETSFSPNATPQQIGQCPSSGNDGVGLSSVIYYIKSSDIIADAVTPITSGTSTVSIKLRLEGTRFLLADSTITINALVSADYSINSFVPNITAVQLTPNYTYTPVSSYGLQYKFVLPPSGILPGGVAIPTEYQKVAKFVCANEKDIFISNFNSLYTNTNDYTGPVATPLTYPQTFALSQYSGKDFPYLFSTWDTVTLTEQPEVDSFGVVLYNYPYGSQYLPIDNKNKNIVYNWRIIQDPDTHTKAKIILTRPDDINVYNVVLTPTNTSLTASYYDSYDALVTNWDTVVNSKRNHKYIKGLYIDTVTNNLTYDIDTTVINNPLQFIIINATSNDLYITSTKINWEIDHQYTYTGNYCYNYNYLMYDVITGLGPIPPHTQGRFVLEAVEPNMWSLETITLDSIGSTAPIYDVIT